MAGRVTELSPIMKERVRRYGHKLDKKLLSECAYYPRGGCQDCEWNSPNPDCPVSHILIDTRIDKRGLKIRTKSTPTQNRLFNSLPASVREQIEKLLEGR